MKFFSVARLLAVLSAAAFLVSCQTGRTPVTPEPGAAGQTPRALPLSATSAPINPVDTAISRVVRDVSPAVVGIETLTRGNEGLVTAIGSGVIVHETGYVLTNHHVAGTAEHIQLVFSDGSRKVARRLWSDAALDLAMLKIEGVHQSARLARSQDIVVGETVVAIGTPLTLQFQHTVTSGIVSAVNRMLNVPSGADKGESFLENLIQHDASINPGNSGGPLLNLSGEVIGINTVKVTQAEGIGFAVPVDIARVILDHFIADGEYVTPYVGVFAIDGDMALYYDDSLIVKEGLVVINVDPEGPAAEAGIAQGDVLLFADNAVMDTMLDLRIAVMRHKVGETTELTVRRDGREYQAHVTLTKVP